MNTLRDGRFFAAVTLLLLLPPPASAQPTSLAVTDVSVIDVESGRALPGRTVLIENGRITSVSTATDVPADTRVLDGTGRYLMSGLWDVHVHLRNPSGPMLMSLNIAHGVTGVRDMSSACDGPGPVCLPELRRWRAEVEAGERVGPRLLALSTAPVNPAWDDDVTEDQARAYVRRWAGEGVDWIKVYFRLSPDGLRWMADEAREQGIAVGGHIPLRMTSRQASQAGLRSLEHARDFLFDCFPGAAEWRASATSQNPPVDVMRSMVDEHDPAACEEIFRTFARNDTWYVPTHVTRRMDAYADDPAFRADARRRYVPAPRWEHWQQDADRMVALDPSPEGRRVMRGFYERGLEITGRAHRAGVKIALGTDAGDTYVFPGSGVHDELGELVKAGLSPAEALAAATLRSAEFLGLQAEHGSVVAGKRADLVLLNANPLDDIANVRQIEAVIVGGRVFDRGALDGLLRDAARSAGEPSSSSSERDRRTRTSRPPR